MAVVLTVTGDKGAVGVQVVSRYGGRRLVQNQATSQAYAMPVAALQSDPPGAPAGVDDLACAITTT